MTPYLYAPIQMRATPRQGEWRTVATMVHDTEAHRTFLSCTTLSRVVHWDHDQLEIAREVIHDLVEEATRAATPFRQGRYANIHDWWAARAAKAEGLVRLTPAKPGITHTIEEEAPRILRKITGYVQETRTQGIVQRAIRDALRVFNARDGFRPKTIQAGEADVHFSRCWATPNRLITLETFDLTNLRQPNQVIARAGKRYWEAELLKQAGEEIFPIFVVAKPRDLGVARAWPQAELFLTRAGGVIVPPEVSSLQTTFESQGLLQAEAA